jgi:glutathione S-transferase
MSERPLLVLGNRNYSSWSLRPWLFMRQAGLEFDTNFLSLDTQQFREQAPALLPAGRVPVLHDGALAIWDSLAICEYVRENFLDGRGWPRERGARAMAHSIVAEMHSGFVALRSECPMNVRRRLDRPLPLSPVAQADAARVAMIWRDARSLYGANGPFLFGEFGIADAFYAPVASRLETYRVPVGPVERTWMDALFAEPAMREWMDAAAREPERLPKYDLVGT